MNGVFPEDSAARKEYPVYSGFLQYFPSAIAAIAHHSYKGNQKHNPGQSLHHDRAKSDDEPDALMRHLIEDDLIGMAWRAMSLLQKHREANGAPIAPAARNAVVPPAPDPVGNDGDGNTRTPPSEAEIAAADALRRFHEAQDADVPLRAAHPISQADED